MILHQGLRMSHVQKCESFEVQGSELVRKYIEVYLKTQDLPSWRFPPQTQHIRSLLELVLEIAKKRLGESRDSLFFQGHATTNLTRLRQTQLEKDL